MDPENEEQDTIEDILKYAANWADEMVGDKDRDEYLADFTRVYHDALRQTQVDIYIARITDLQKLIKHGESRDFVAGVQRAIRLLTRARFKLITKENK